MDQTESLIESMLQFLESSNDEDDGNSFTNDQTTNEFVINSDESGFTFSKSQELSEPDSPLKKDACESEELPIDSNKEENELESKIQYQIKEESSKYKSDEETLLLRDTASNSNFTEDVVEVNFTDKVLHGRDSEISCSISSEISNLPEYSRQYEPLRSRFKRSTINAVYVREELEKIRGEYPLSYAPFKELKKRQIQEKSQDEKLYVAPVLIVSGPHMEEKHYINPDPFSEEIHRCIYGKLDNDPPEGSEEYFKAAENYAIFGKSNSCVSSREASPSTQSTELDSSLEECESVLFFPSEEELSECDYNLSPATEIEEDSRSVPLSIPELSVNLQSQQRIESIQNPSPLPNNFESLGMSAFGPYALKKFTPSFRLQSNYCNRSSQYQNQYFPYRQPFISPSKTMPYFSVAAYESEYSMDHQRQRTVYQQHGYTNSHIQIGPSAHINHNINNPQHHYVTPVNTYPQYNQAQYNFNQDHISRAHIPVMPSTHGEHNISSYYGHTSHLQTYQGRFLCPLIFQQPPYPRPQYQQHHWSYVPRPRLIHAFSSPYNMQERTTAIRFRPPYIPPSITPFPIRFQRFNNPTIIKNVRYGNIPRSLFNNKYNNKSNIVDSRLRPIQNRESSSSLTTAKSSPTVSNITRNKGTEFIEAIVGLHKTDDIDIENSDELL